MPAILLPRPAAQLANPPPKHDEDHTTSAAAVIQ